MELAADAADIWVVPNSSPPGLFCTGRMKRCERKFDYFSVMGLAFSFVNFALPCNSGTRPASFFGGLFRSGSGLLMPFFAIQNHLRNIVRREKEKMKGKRHLLPVKTAVCAKTTVNKDFTRSYRVIRCSDAFGLPRFSLNRQISLFCSEL